MRKYGRYGLWPHAGVLACAAFPAVESPAQGYPARPIYMVVGFAAGGGTDVTARLVAQRLSEDFGQSVIVENRTGAGGSISVQRVARSPADGYTLLMMSSSSILQWALQSRPSYHIERDLSPISLVTIGPMVLVVHPSVPARNVKELIALARAQPGKLNYGSSGIGGTSHLASEFFNSMAKVRIVHVPYKGGSESVVATAAGHVDTNFPTVTSALPLLEAGKLRPLAVTSSQRASLIPSTPTLAEAGLPGYDYSVWFSMLAPAGVPKDIIVRLNAATAKAVGLPEMKEAFKKLGLEPQASSPEDLAQLIRREIAQNASFIKMTGLKIE